MKKSLVKKGRKGWLVLWESFHGDGIYLEKLSLPTFVCVLPPNLKSGSVKMILKALWSMWEPTMEGKIASGASPHFPKEWIQEGRGWTGPITFGYDPFLTARLVDMLKVVNNDSGEDLYFVIHDERDVHGKINPPRSCVLKHGQRS